MNIADLAILAIVAVSGLLGLLWGLVRELLGLVAWALAILAGITLSQFFQGFMSRFIHDSDLVDVASFLAPFLIVLVFLWVLAGIISDMVRRSPVGGLDRLLGFFFGMARGAALIVVAYIVLGKVVPQNSWPTDLQHARSLPLLDQASAWAAMQLPPKFRPYLEGNPGEAETGPGMGEAPTPSVPFGHPFGADPHSHVPGYTPGPGQ